MTTDKHGDIWPIGTPWWKYKDTSMIEMTNNTTKVGIPVLAKRHAGPRLFTVKWDNSKTRTRDTRKHEKHEAFGTVYPNGLVTLDNGTIYATMSELHHLLDLKGQYEIAYLDEQEAAQ